MREEYDIKKEHVFQSRDDEFYVAALGEDRSFEILRKEVNNLAFGKRLTKDWLYRHSGIAICNIPKPWVDTKNPYSNFRGIIGMVEVISCDPLFGGGYKYVLGRKSFLDDPFPYKQRQGLSRMSVDILEKFLAHTGYKVW